MSESPFSPSTLPSDTEVTHARTNNLNFAAAVIAADLLRYVSTEITKNSGDPVFVLKDLNELAPELQRQFNRGVFPHVSPRMLFDVRAFLLDEAARVRGTVRRGQV
jgi:hypothetical protein